MATPRLVIPANSQVNKAVFMKSLGVSHLAPEPSFYQVKSPSGDAAWFLNLADAESYAQGTPVVRFGGETHLGFWLPAVA